jgi:hypothetical protein
LAHPIFAELGAWHVPLMNPIQEGPVFFLADSSAATISVSRAEHDAPSVSLSSPAVGFFQ